MILVNERLKVILLTPYNPDLEPCDFFFLPNSKNIFEVQYWILARLLKLMSNWWFAVQDEHFYFYGNTKRVKRWQKYIDSEAIIL